MDEMSLKDAFSSFGDVTEGARFHSLLSVLVCNVLVNVASWKNSDDTSV